MTPISRTERKPIFKKRPSGKFLMADFQREDLAFLSELDSSANWSELSGWEASKQRLLSGYSVTN
jgi:hypothetical protein